MINSWQQWQVAAALNQAMYTSPRSTTLYSAAAKLDAQPKKLMQGTKSKRPVVLEPGTWGARPASLPAQQPPAEGGTEASAGLAARHPATHAAIRQTKHLKVRADAHTDIHQHAV